MHIMFSEMYCLPDSAYIHWYHDIRIYYVMDMIYNYILQYVVWVTEHVFSLFNDAFSETQTIQHRMKGWQMNDDLEWMWKEAVVA
jgi:hypothetical protein